jgi:hypothetical protein
MRRRWVLYMVMANITLLVSLVRATPVLADLEITAPFTTPSGGNFNFVNARTTLPASADIEFNFTFRVSGGMGTTPNFQLFVFDTNGLLVFTKTFNVGALSADQLGARFVLGGGSLSPRSYRWVMVMFTASGDILATPFAEFVAQ